MEPSLKTALDCLTIDIQKKLGLDKSEAEQFAAVLIADLANKPKQEMEELYEIFCKVKD